MFEPVNKIMEHVRNTESGLEVRLEHLPDHEIRVVVTLKDGRSASFGIAVEPKFRDKPFVLGDRSNPTILIPVSGLQRIAKFLNGSVEENTRLVRSVLQALSAINNLQPLSRNPYFYTDRELSLQKIGDPFFVLPAEEEIASL